MTTPVRERLRPLLPAAGGRLIAAALLVGCLHGTGCSNAESDVPPAASPNVAATSEPTSQPRIVAPTLSPEVREQRATLPIVETSFEELSLPLPKEGRFEWAMTPEKIDDLRGRTIRLRGWIHPLSVFSQKLTQFVLVGEDVNVHMRGVPTSPADGVLQITVAPPGEIDFTTAPIALEGRFSLDPIDIDGATRLLYRLDDAKLVETPASMARPTTATPAATSRAN